MEFNETLELGLEQPILSNHIQKYGRKPYLGGRPANCTQNSNVDLGMSLMLTALCRANQKPTNQPIFNGRYYKKQTKQAF